MIIPKSNNDPYGLEFDRCLSLARYVYPSPDNPHAQEIGNLHLIQQSRRWWMDKFKEYIPNSVIYRLDRCVFVVKNV